MNNFLEFLPYKLNAISLPSDFIGYFIGSISFPSFCCFPRRFSNFDNRTLRQPIACEWQTNKDNKKQPSSPKAQENEQEKGQIGIEDFAKVELRVALVTACERVEKSDKLLKLTLSLGNEATRTVASGIAAYYKPEEVVGKKVILVSNLKPATLRGVKSEGMILCAEKDGVVTLVEPNQKMPEGSVVR